ncbi:hypothetical protein P4G43_25065 (plasmid) [Shigella boydii]|nr:hypothetical protein [Shigella boydii]MDS1488537.1 hypothetical protein [Shigella boydii]
MDWQKCSGIKRSYLAQNDKKITSCVFFGCFSAYLNKNYITPTKKQMLNN